MSVETKYFCDMCGAVRGDANHWFVVNLTNVGYHLYLWGWAEAEGRLDDDDANHLCGQKCVHALLDRWLTTGSLDANRHEDVPNS